MTSPPSSTASAAPGSRGALRNVLTTVASPNVSSAAHHLVIVFRMSRTAPPRSLTGTTTLPSNGEASHSIFATTYVNSPQTLNMPHAGTLRADGRDGRTHQPGQRLVGEAFSAPR